MSKRTAAITGVQGYLPEYIMTNAELEKIVDTNDEWIRSRTGIKERRILKNEGWATSDMAVEAVKGLLHKTGTKPEEVEMIICATITADFRFPDAANTIADKAGCKNAFGYDINAACSGFLFALTTGAKFVETGTYKKVIVVGVDMMSSMLDWNDRTTCIIFGDGAGAVMLEPNEEGYGIVDSVLRGDGSGRIYLHQKGGGSMHPASQETIDKRWHTIYQEGRPVFKFAVRGMSETVREVLQRNELTLGELDWLVPHQANIRIIEAVGHELGLPSEKVMVTIDHTGNTTAATLPLCLWEYEERLKKGDHIVLTAFGGGFTWGATYIRWAYDGFEAGV
jgi:3-oxoacyl-[acyl-carrier-protein] synthase-3